MTARELNLKERLPFGPGALFTGPVFFGSPDCRDEVDRAHAQLDEAFTLSGGLQQPLHCDSEEGAAAGRAADLEGRARVRALARSLVVALGASEILDQDAGLPRTPPPMSYYPDHPPHYQMPPVPELPPWEKLKTRCRNLRLGEPALGVNVALNDRASHTVRTVLTFRLDATAELSLEEIGASEPSVGLTASVRDHMYGRLCERALRLLAAY